MDMIDMMTRASKATGQIMAGIQPDQFGNPTPCSEWDVRAEANHLVGAVSMSVSVAKREAAQDPHEGPMPDMIGDDPGAAFSKAADAMVEAWRQPGALDGTVQLGSAEMPASFAASIFFFDTLVHGWDVAKATGQDTSVFEPEVAEAVLEVASQLVNDDSRGEGKPFGPEVKVPEDASVMHRLVALTGRQP